MDARTAARRAAGVSMVSALLIGAGAAMSAADDERGNEDITISVDIDEIDEPGYLALTVADNAVTLPEEGSDENRRQFVGTLPTVTVTDTRVAGEIADGAAWYVMGSSTDFLGDAGQDPIDAGHLGWAPEIVGANDGGGLVAPGDDVLTILDEPTPEAANVGLVDQELLFSTWDSSAIAPEGTWSATADLFLRVPTDVAPGGYTSQLTLSLFE